MSLGWAGHAGGDDKVEQIIVDALQQPPPDEATHWSTRAMAKHAQVSQSMVTRVWRTFRAQTASDRHDTWKLSSEPSGPGSTPRTPVRAATNSGPMAPSAAKPLVVEERNDDGATVSASFALFTPLHLSATFAAFISASRPWLVLRRNGAGSSGQAV